MRTSFNTRSIRTAKVIFALAAVLSLSELRWLSISNRCCAVSQLQ